MKVKGEFYTLVLGKLKIQEELIFMWEEEIGKAFSPSPFTLFDRLTARIADTLYTWTVS